MNEESPDKDYIQFESDRFKENKIELLTENGKILVSISDLFETLGQTFHANGMAFRKLKMFLSDSIHVLELKKPPRKEYYIDSDGVFYLLAFLEDSGGNLMMFIQGEAESFFATMKDPSKYKLLAATLDCISTKKALKSLRTGSGIAKLSVFERASKSMKSSLGSLEKLSNHGRNHLGDLDREALDLKIANLSNSILDQFASLTIDSELQEDFL